MTRRVALALAGILLVACHARNPRHPVAPQPTVPVDGGHLVYQATFADGAGSRRFRLAMALARPGQFRLVFLGPVGGPRVILATDGRTLQAAFPPQRLFAEAAATPEQMDILLGLPLAPDEFLGLLTGSPGRTANPRSGVHLTYSSDDMGNLQQAKVEVTDSAGNASVYTVEYLDPEEGPWGRHPQEIRLRQGDRALNLRLKSASRELPQAQAFQVRVPNGFQQVAMNELPALGGLLFDAEEAP